jgi:hypothetical protein
MCSVFKDLIFVMVCEKANLQLHLTFTSALDGSEWPASLSIHCTQGKSHRNTLNRRMIVPAARLAALELGTFIVLLGIKRLTRGSPVA